LVTYKLVNKGAKTIKDHRVHREEELDHAGLQNRVLRKAETVILGRTSRIILVVERCTDDHNYSAIIRTAEALGIQHVWLIDPVVTLDSVEYQKLKLAESNEDIINNKDNNNGGDDGDHFSFYNEEEESAGDMKFASTSDKVRYEHGKFARRATEWITVREFKTSKECLQALRADNRTIWATDLSQKACRLTAQDLPLVNEQGGVIPDRLAIVFGTESVGVTEEILQACDLRVYLPLRGFADSLNLSVAAALIIQQLYRLDPFLIGAMSESERHELRSKWYPKMVATRAESGPLKKELRKISQGLIDVEYMKQKLDQTNADGSKYLLSAKQKEKLAKEPELLAREKEIKDKIWKLAQAAVANDIENPPAPLTDVRRCDEHRTPFVGVNVKKKNAEHWKGMAATANYDGNKKAPNSAPRVDKV
jgi:tRNA G18 (ribose-2'-O)-methylase SpoU